MQCNVAPRITKWIQPRLSLAELRPLLATPADVSDALVPAVATSIQREDVWPALFRTFFDPHSSSTDRATAGIRLSWFYPSADQEKNSELANALSKVSEQWIVSTVRTVDRLLEDGNDNSAELLGELLLIDSALPLKLASMLREKKIKANLREAAVQILELKDREYMGDLREELGMK